MISPRALFVIVAILVAGCDGSTDLSFDEMLVDRFDAPECEDVQLLRAGGEKHEDGHKAMREYQADEQCVEALQSALSSMDFVRVNENTYVARRDGDWTETVTIGVSGIDTEANVIWEEINP